MEYYSAIKRNEILIHATMWMNLENIMLNVKSQTHNFTDYMIPFTCNIQNKKSVETESRLVVARA